MRNKNQKKASLCLLFGLGICSGILLVNRFIIDIPDWLAIVLMVIAVISLVMGLFYKKYKK